MKKILALLSFMAVSLFSITSVMAQPVEHNTVLTGKVTSVLPVGSPVAEGDTLVTVETLAGPMAASKATVSGVVTSVNVAVGTNVQRGQAVAVVESK